MSNAFLISVYTIDDYGICKQLKSEDLTKEKVIKLINKAQSWEKFKDTDDIMITTEE